MEEGLGGLLLYRGNFVDGVRSGEGVGKCAASGCTYTGEWINGAPAVNAVKFGKWTLHHVVGKWCFFLGRGDVSETPFEESL